MNAEQFQSTAIAILRSAVGWQSAIGRKLDVEPRTVRRWIKAGETPGWVDEKFADWTGHSDITAWPRDEWVVGEALGQDGRVREYIVHSQPPRFVARVVALDGDGGILEDQHPADTLSGVVYSSDEFTELCEIDWIDEVAPGETVKWLEAAADALNEYSDKMG
jgi:hypothetical protein